MRNVVFYDQVIYESEMTAYLVKSKYNVNYNLSEHMDLFSILLWLLFVSI